MSLEKILAITGKPGLFKLTTQTRTGFVAESLIDGKKITAGMRSNVSLLSEIQMYCYNTEIKLFEVFKNIAAKENFGTIFFEKEDNTTLLKYFREVLPEFDEDRVYVSDIKKALKWYNILQAKGYISAEKFAEYDKKFKEKEA